MDSSDVTGFGGKGDNPMGYVIDRLKENNLNKYSDKITDELADPIDQNS